VEQRVSTGLTVTGLGYVVQRAPPADASDVRALGEGGLCGFVVVASVVSTKIMRILTMKIAQRFSGGDGLCGMY
jgi:hypothetical protein